MKPFESKPWGGENEHKIEGVSKWLLLHDDFDPLYIIDDPEYFFRPCTFEIRRRPEKSIYPDQYLLVKT